MSLQFLSSLSEIGARNALFDWGRKVVEISKQDGLPTGNRSGDVARLIKGQLLGFDQSLTPIQRSRLSKDTILWKVLRSSQKDGGLTNFARRLVKARQISLLQHYFIDFFSVDPGEAEYGESATLRGILLTEVEFLSHRLGYDETLPGAVER